MPHRSFAAPGWWPLLLWLFATLVAPPARANDDWPHWRGPHRNGHTAAPSGYDGQQWPVEKSWSRQVGVGSTSPIVVGDALFTLGRSTRGDRVWRLHVATGEIAWEQTYPAPEYGRHATGDEGLYKGPTGTPEYDAETGALYTLSVDGDLICWSAADGARRWSRNLYDDYQMPRRPRVGRSGQRDYGYTSSPLAIGETLIVEVGGDAGTLIGFDKRTGQQRWASQARDPAGHNAGPTPITVAGVPCVALLTFDHVRVVRIDGDRAGQTVASFPWLTEWGNNIASLAVYENHVIVTSEYNQNAMCLLRITLDGAEQVWRRSVASKICTPVVHAGKIYWSWSRVQCLDFATGELVWEGPTTGDAGSLIATGDDRFLALVGRGDLLLFDSAERSPGGYREVGRVSRVGQSDMWPHVVLAGGRVFCKDRLGNLQCLTLPGAK